MHHEISKGSIVDRLPTKKVMGIVVPVDLDSNGLEMGKHCEVNASFRAERVLATRKIIRQHFSRTQEIQRTTSSYGLKHIVENQLGCHLSNGELILAMLGEGYYFRRNGINCQFNVSLRSVKVLQSLNTI